MHLFEDSIVDCTADLPTSMDLEQGDLPPQLVHPHLLGKKLYNASETNISFFHLHGLESWKEENNP